MNNTRLTDKEKLGIIESIGIMLRAGIPILEAVDSVRKESKTNPKKVLDKLYEDLQQGKKIGESFEESSESFGPITINLIKSAEESGNLDEVLKEITENIKKDTEFKSKIRASLTYPLIIFVLFIGIMLVILTYVIPRISQVFKKLKVTLPWTTKTLIAVSDFFLANTLAIIVGVILLTIILILFYRFKKKVFVDLLFSLPLIKQLGLEIDLAQFTRSLSHLLKAGVPIVKALEHSEQVVARKVVADAIAKTKEMVINGKRLTDGFKTAPKVFPSLMLRITEAGEMSGGLEESMGELASQFENRVTNALKTITTVMEPLMLVVIGLFVGGIMLSIIAPIYQLIGNISPR